MGYARYWQPPTLGDQRCYGIAFVALLLPVIYLFAKTGDSFFTYFVWGFFVVVLGKLVKDVFTAKYDHEEIKDRERRGEETKMGVDVMVVSVICIILSVLGHLFVEALV